MTPAALMEILTSLTVQAGAIVLLTGWLTRDARDPVVNDRLWSLSFGLILALSGCCLLVPHLRWVVFSSLTPAAWQPDLYNALERASRLTILFWFGGCIFYLGLLVLGMVRGALLVHRSPLLRSTENSSLGPLPAQIHFRTSSQVNSPFLWQVHRPTIVLPARVLGFDSDTLHAILNHEVAHFRAGHPLQLFLQRLVEILFWYHPLVWWASRRAAISRELRCDWEAVTTDAQAESLLNGLILLLDERSRPHRPALTRLDFLGSSNRLSARAASLLRKFNTDQPEPRKRQSFQVSSLVLVATGLLGFIVCWLPVNPEASQRSHFSPWPVWSASAMDLLGVQVRDYEIDGHRLQPH